MLLAKRHVADGCLPVDLIRRELVREVCRDVAAADFVRDVREQRPGLNCRVVRTDCNGADGRVAAEVGEEVSPSPDDVRLRRRG